MSAYKPSDYFLAINSVNKKFNEECESIRNEIDSNKVFYDARIATLEERIKLLESILEEKNNNV